MKLTYCMSWCDCRAEGAVKEQPTCATQSHEEKAPSAADPPPQLKRQLSATALHEAPQPRRRRVEADSPAEVTASSTEEP